MSMTKQQKLAWQNRAQRHFAVRFLSIIEQYDMVYRSRVQGHVPKEDWGSTQWWFQNLATNVSLQFDSAVIFANYIAVSVMVDITEDPCLFDVIRIDSTKDFSRDNLKVVLRAGQLPKQQPCPCGEAEVEAHPLDCNKPLKMIWLCRQCHRKLHKLLRLEAVL